MLIHPYILAPYPFGRKRPEQRSGSEFLSFVSLGAWGVWNTWMGEIYETHRRGQGVAWGVINQRVANTIAPITIGAILASGSFLQTVSFILVFLGVTFVADLFLPETEGKILT